MKTQNTTTSTQSVSDFLKAIDNRIISYKEVKEVNKDGKEIITYYAVVYSPGNGYLIATIMGNKMVASHGTPSSKGKKHYKRNPRPEYTKIA